jgi:hypothetical protein
MWNRAFTRPASLAALTAVSLVTSSGHALGASPSEKVVLKSAPSAAAIPIGVVINGPRGVEAGQGLVFLALDRASAPNVNDPYMRSAYSPLWEAYALPRGRSARIKDYATFESLRPQKAASS